MKHILIILAALGIGIITDRQTFIRAEGLTSSLRSTDQSIYFPIYLQQNGYQHRYINEPYEVVSPEEAGYTQEELNEIYHE